jgi:amidase
MARNVEDTALFLDAISGEDPRDPLTLPPPPTAFLTAAQTRRKPLKVAFSPDLGITPVDPEIANNCRRAALRFEELGVVVEEANPDFSDVHECYKTIRAFEFSQSMSKLPDELLAQLKPGLADNLALGRNLDFNDISRATTTRSVIRNRVLCFFETYDLLLTPTTIVAPFAVEQRFVETCNNIRFDTYLDWLAIAYAVTLVSLPALSLPRGFTQSGLPVGLQVVARAR